MITLLLLGILLMLFVFTIRLSEISMELKNLKQ